MWWRGQARFEARYNLTRFPAVVYAPEPRARPDAFEVWDGGPQPWKEWLWERLAFEVEVVNDGDAAVEASVVAPRAAGRSPAPPVRIEAGGAPPAWDLPRRASS